MSAIQAFLQTGGTIEQLKTDYAIDVKRHPSYPNLCLFKYNQIESPFDKQIVREARGIILDEENDWSLVCARFNKFFNSTEQYAAKIDWSSARVQSKVDGSLMTIYHYKDKWHVASSGTPDASGNCQGWDFSFADLFWETFNEMGLKVPDNKQLCISFELTSPYNRVVVPHKSALLTLIGIHDLEYGGSEVRVDIPSLDVPPYPVVKSYPLTTLDEVMEAVDKLDGLNNEGFVVVDQDFNRIKIKSPKYLMLHHLKDSWSPPRVIEIIRAGETSEIIAYFPEYAEDFNDAQKRYDWLVKHLEDIYAEISGIEDQKTYALALQKRKPLIPGALYMLKRGKVESVKKYLAEMNIRSLMDTLGLRDKEDDGEKKYEAKSIEQEADEAEALPEIVFDNEPMMGN